MSGEFTLENDPPAPHQEPLPTPVARRQMVMLTGLDCLPGQQDLFQTDGHDRLYDLEAGDRFSFSQDGLIYDYNGNGWYGRPYSGGPWHHSREENPVVYPQDQPLSEETNDVTCDLG